MNIQGYEKLPETFYLNQDVLGIAKALLGKVLFTNINGMLTGGKIVETEAYKGGEDKASHATRGRTARTEVVFGSGGHAYVYLCYGIHHLLNIVTNEAGKPDCVLIRALEPVLGESEMCLRRGKSAIKRITSGPGTVSQALGITTKDNGETLHGDRIWIAKDLQNFTFGIVEAPRIGVAYAGEDALLPWRYYVKDNPFVSELIK